ncbi:hypothetical protein G3I44_15760 [Halogeometricum borinquense]|uniref:Uncharacterized protein n=2 Tax=Halogeometricum borinquense TaxID=60847 RepID=A0A6C0UP04_9EURY|nr:hypothetical protein G3I44_15760 [Halogeometricum borinquense]
MAMRITSRVRTVELVLSVTSLVTIVVLSAIPPMRLSSLSSTVVGRAIAFVIWMVPLALSAVVLYRVRASKRSKSSYVIGGLSVLTAVLILLDTQTVVVSEGFLTHSGTGAFSRPLIAVVAGSLLATAVVIKELVSQAAGQQSAQTS